MSEKIKKSGSFRARRKSTSSIGGNVQVSKSGSRINSSRGDESPHNERRGAGSVIVPRRERASTISESAPPSSTSSPAVPVGLSHREEDDVVAPLSGSSEPLPTQEESVTDSGSRRRKFNTEGNKKKSNRLSLPPGLFQRTGSRIFSTAVQDQDKKHKAREIAKEIDPSLLSPKGEADASGGESQHSVTIVTPTSKEQAEKSAELHLSARANPAQQIVQAKKEQEKKEKKGKKEQSKSDREEKERIKKENREKRKSLRKSQKSNKTKLGEARKITITPEDYYDDVLDIETDIPKLVQMIREKCKENEILKLQIEELQIRMRNEQKDTDYYKTSVKHLTADLEAAKNRLRHMADLSGFRKGASSTPSPVSSPAMHGEGKSQSNAMRRARLQVYSTIDFSVDGQSVFSRLLEAEAAAAAGNAQAVENVNKELADRPEASELMANLRQFKQRKKQPGKIIFLENTTLKDSKGASLRPAAKASADGQIPLIPKLQGYNIEKEVEYDFAMNPVSVEREAWYQQHFFKMQHQNFIGKDTPLGTVIISVRREYATQSFIKRTPSTEGEHEESAFYRVLLQTQDGEQTMLIPASTIEISGVYASSVRLFTAINPVLLSTGTIKEIDNPTFPNALKEQEEKERPRRYKFGVLLVKEGQDKESEMFSNCEGSKDWDEFLDVIGDDIKLEGWTKFAAGLDVKLNTTGTRSRYVHWRENQIMWHVSTLMPFMEANPQQLERKRHIGNDIVLVVFLDGPTATFDPSCISSHFIHIVIAVRKAKAPPFVIEEEDTKPEDKDNEKEKEGADAAEQPQGDKPTTTDQSALAAAQQKATWYEITVCTKDDVPICGPPLPRPATFLVSMPDVTGEDAAAVAQAREKFRDFLYAKVINSELAAQRSLYFSKKLRRGRAAVLDLLARQYYPQEPEAGTTK